MFETISCNIFHLFVLFFSAKTIKAKWKNLRAYFTKELRNISQPKSGSGGSEIVISTWSHFKQMLFLKDVVQVSEGIRDSNIASQVCNTEQNPAVGSECCELTVLTDQTNCDSDSTPVEILSPSTNISSSSTNRFRVNKRKLSRHSTVSDASKSNQELVHIEQKKLALLEHEIKSEEDPELCFFKSLLPYMRELSPTRRLRLRGKIQNLISEEYEQRNLPVGPTQWYSISMEQPSSDGTTTQDSTQEQDNIF